MVREAARKSVDGVVSPLDGAREIESIGLEHDSEFETDFMFKFYDLTDEYMEFSDYQRRVYYGEEHCQRARAELEAEIIIEAHKILI